MKKKIRSLLCLLLLAVLSLTACGSSTAEFTDEAVLKIDGQEIMKSEYMVYLYTTTQSFVAAAGEDVWNMDFDGQTADELVEERTISTLQSVKAAEEYAAANGIALTDEQKEEAKAAAEQFISTVDEADLAKMGIDTEKLIPLMEASYLYSLVYESIAAECAVDEADMAAYYEEQKGQIKEDYTTLKLATILLDDGEKAAEAADRAKAGEDFAALFQEYDVDPAVQSGEENGETTMYQSYMLANFGLAEPLEVGEIAGPIQVEEGRYFILKALEKTVPSEEEVKQMAETGYQDKIQTEYTEARIDEMVKAQKVEKVESVWETLEKFH
ncbi:peptidyl-prolyl cis-trans isomerase [Anaerotignum sp.]